MARVDPDRRKAAIVAAAFDLIARDGVEAATMRRVAAAAEATTGRVTHYFTTRVELLVTTLSEVDRRRTERLAIHVDLEPAARLRATLLELLPLDAPRLDEHRVWISLSTTGIPEVRDEILRQTFERHGLVEVLIATTFGRTPNDAAVFELLALVDGLAQRLMLDTTTKPRRTALQVLEGALASAAVRA